MARCDLTWIVEILACRLQAYSSDSALFYIQHEQNQQTTQTGLALSPFARPGAGTVALYALQPAHRAKPHLLDTLVYPLAWLASS